MYRYDHKRVVSYTTYAAQLIATSAAMNGIDAPRSAIHLALNAQTDPDDISGHLKEQLKDLPNNRAEFYALEEKRQLAINEIKDQQASS